MSALDELLGPEIATPSDWPFLDYLSASQLTMFRRCPEQYRRRYVLGHKERPNINLIWGGADHFAHEQNFRQKIETHEDLPVDDVQGFFVEAFDRKAEEEAERHEKGVDWQGKTPGKAKDLGVALVGAYHRNVSPTLQPLEVEQEFLHGVSGVPVPIKGYIDLRAGQGTIERKTSGKKVSKPKDEWWLQGWIYQLVSREPVSWHVSVKTQTPAIVTPAEAPALELPLVQRELRRAEQMIRMTAMRMLGAYEQLGPDRPWPDAITHGSCSWCGYRPTCWWWQG